MKLLKAIYYRVKFKEAKIYFEYWREKANANLKNMERWKACMNRAIYWLYKMLDYNTAMHKLES